jgi:hypothetical protein
MLKQSVCVAVVLAIGCVLVLGLGTLASSQDKKPPTATRAGLHQIHAAARALEQAHRHLERAEHHFGGHRVKALDLVKQAEAAVKEAVAFAKANPPEGSKPAPAATSAPGTTPPAAAPATKP